nr:sperm-activating peptides-like [Halyomorpha halys]
MSAFDTEAYESSGSVDDSDDSCTNGLAQTFLPLPIIEIDYEEDISEPTSDTSDVSPHYQDSALLDGGGPGGQYLLYGGGPGEQYLQDGGGPGGLYLLDGCGPGGQYLLDGGGLGRQYLLGGGGPGGQYLLDGGGSGGQYSKTVLLQDSLFSV